MLCSFQKWQDSISLLLVLVGLPQLSPFPSSFCALSPKAFAHTYQGQRDTFLKLKKRKEEKKKSLPGGGPLAFLSGSGLPSSRAGQGVKAAGGPEGRGSWRRQERHGSVQRRPAEGRRVTEEKEIKRQGSGARAGNFPFFK